MSMMVVSKRNKNASSMSRRCIFSICIGSRIPLSCAIAVMLLVLHASPIYSFIYPTSLSSLSSLSSSRTQDVFFHNIHHHHHHHHHQRYYKRYTRFHSIMSFAKPISQTDPTNNIDIDTSSIDININTNSTNIPNVQISFGDDSSLPTTSSTTATTTTANTILTKNNSYTNYYANGNNDQQTSLKNEEFTSLPISASESTTTSS